MNIEITQDVLDEVNVFVNKYFVAAMVNIYPLSFESMAFILQTMRNAIDEAQQRLDKE